MWKTISSNPMPRSDLSFAFFASSPIEVPHRLQNRMMCAYKAHVGVSPGVPKSVPKRGPTTIIRHPTPTKRGSSRPPEVECGPTRASFIAATLVEYDWAPSCEDCAGGRTERPPAWGAVRYGSSTALITWTIPFDAEMSVAAMPAAESASRVSVPPFSIW